MGDLGRFAIDDLTVDEKAEFFRIPEEASLARRRAQRQTVYLRNSGSSRDRAVIPPLAEVIHAG